MSKLFQLLGRNKSKDRARARKLAPKLPDSERVRYFAKINAFWSKWEKRVYSQLELRRDAHQDALPPLIRSGFIQMLEESDLGTFLDSIGDRITSKALRYMKEVVRVPASVPGKEALLDSFREENIRLIRGVGEEQVKLLDELFSGAGGTATRAEEVAPEVKRILGVGQSRAELIARDQILKLNSSVHQQAQRSAGVNDYVWSTSNDERVRESHDRLDGTRQAWDNPPTVDGEQVHPGEAVQCRCVSVPVIPFLDDI